VTRDSERVNICCQGHDHEQHFKDFSRRLFIIIVVYQKDNKISFINITYNYVVSYYKREAEWDEPRVVKCIRGRNGFRLS